MAALFIAELIGRHLQRPFFDSLTVTSMAMWVIFNAACFSHIYTALGASDFMIALVGGLNISPMGVIWIMMIIYFVLGMFLDPAGECLITVPIFVPIIVNLGFDPLWFGILFVVSTEMDFLTPPFGFNLFYLKSVVPSAITMGDIYRSVIPFVAIQFIAMVLVMYFPQIGMWLPSQMTKQR